MKKCKLVDFNKLYDERYKVTNYKDIDRDKKFTEDGIFSEKIFGSLTDDNIDTIGWIDLEENYIVNPIMYNHLKRLFGDKFDRMIKYAKVLNKEGEVSLEEEQQQENWEEDDNLGLKLFKEKFIEMIEKWANKDKYSKEYNFIMDNLGYVFINKFPVFNAKLRPASLIENTLTKDEINNYYIFILRYLDEIKGLKEDYLVQPLIYNIQTFAMEIWNSTINSYLKGKKGWLRKNNLG